MIKKIKAVWAAGIAAAALITMQIGGAAVLNSYSHHATMFKPTRASIVRDVNLQPASTFHAGDGIVIENFAHVDAVGCTAIFNNWLDGPVRYQFQVARTFRIYTKPEERHGATFFVLPPHLPAGKYHWMVTVFPTCHNYDLAPSMFDTGAEFTVVN